MTPLIVIRPEPGCGRTVSAARELGVPAEGFPLFEIAAIGWDAPPAESFDALLIGSVNAVSHGGSALELYRGKPAYAVGATTAAACAAAGLDVIGLGRGGLQDLLGHLESAHRRLLRLAGAERVPLEPPPGVSVVERVVYASRPLSLPAEVAERLRAGGAVLLHSAAAARHFASECDRLAISRQAVALATIGPRVSEAVGQGWARVLTAATPDDAALLAQARQLCQ